MQKYKVFFNEKCIVIRPSSNITFSKPWAEQPGNRENDGVIDWLTGFVSSSKTETVLEHNSPTELLENFKSAFMLVEAAGGVVLRDEKLLFIFRNGKWDLPKGKIDKGELAKEAAIREIEEECGIEGHKIVKQLPSTFHIYVSPYKESKGQWIFKETFWYEMVYKGAEDGVPQLDEGITKVRWFAKTELDEVDANTYDNLKQIIAIYR